MLAHKASHEGKVAAGVAAGQPAVFDASAIPNVVYTDPEVAWAGLTEKEAKEMGVLYKTGEFPWIASGKAAILGAGEGKTKILFDSDSQRILGIGIVGPGAGDLIAEGALAIEMSADAEDIGLTIHPHPTISETIAGAAEVFTGTITDLYVPKK
jgi:dihydrolipoamide dehydrogenase